MPNEKDHLTPETREELFAAIRDYAYAVRMNAEAEASLREILNTNVNYAAEAVTHATERVHCTVSDKLYYYRIVQNILTKISVA